MGLTAPSQGLCNEGISYNSCTYPGRFFRCLPPVKNFHTCKSIQHGKNYRTTCENILLLPLVIPLSVILRHHTPVNISLPPRRISPVSKLYPIHTPENFSALLRKISPVYPGRFLRLIDKVIDHTIDPP